MKIRNQMKIKVLIIASILIPKILISQNTQNEKFNNFIDEFTTDSVFQFSRIHFPLPYITWDYENNDTEVTYFIQKDKYIFDPLYSQQIKCSDAYSVFYDNFDCEFKDTGEMVFRWVGFTDMDRRYFFKRIEGKWYLIKISSPDPLE